MDTFQTHTSKTPVVGILAAGGTGTRLGAEGGKQLLHIADKPVAAWSLLSLLDTAHISHIVVVCDPLRVTEYAEALLPHIDSEKPLVFVPGGATRQDSVYAGLKEAVLLGADVVVVHDGARPLLKSSELDEALDYFLNQGQLEGLIFGHQSTDTLKRVADKRIELPIVESTPDRGEYFAVQTPQIFQLQTLIAAHDEATTNCYLGTDDASLLEQSKKAVGIWKASRDNIKVTVPEDVVIAQALLSLKGQL